MITGGAPLFAQTSADGSGLFVVIVNNKRGYIDRAGKVVIQPEWSGASDFSEGLARVALYSPHYNEGFIDTTGTLVIPAIYDSASDFEDGLALVGVGTFGLHDSGDHKFGFIDKKGQWVIPAKYRNLYGFSNGLAPAMNEDGKWGFIDKTGSLVIPFQFETGSSFSEGLAPMFSKEKDRYGYIDRSGKWVIEPQFTQASGFAHGVAIVKRDGVLMNPYPLGSTLIGRNEDKDRQFLLINPSGATVFKFGKNVRSIQNFSEDLAAVEIEEKSGLPLTGFIDRNGKFTLEPKYPFVHSFQDGLADFLRDGNWTFMDKTGRIVCSTPYQVSYGFKHGLAFVQELDSGGFIDTRNSKYGYIDKSCNVVWSPTK